MAGVFAGFVANLLYLSEVASSAAVPQEELRYAHELGYDVEDAEVRPLIRRASGVEADAATVQVLHMGTIVQANADGTLSHEVPSSVALSAEKEQGSSRTRHVRDDHSGHLNDLAVLEQLDAYRENGTNGQETFDVMPNLNVKARGVLDTPGNNIFTSCITSADGYNCIQRKVAETRTESRPTEALNVLKYNKDFGLLEFRRAVLHGEDPRFLNSSIVFSNWLDSPSMIDLNTKTVYQVYLNGARHSLGKNYAWFLHQGWLFSIFRFKPLHLIRCAREDPTKDMQEPRLSCVTVSDLAGKDKSDDRYRGGTVGYNIQDGVFGFGHISDDPDHHRVFMWKLHMNGSLLGTAGSDFTAAFETEDVSMPGQHSICDPTSMVWSGGKVFLITAESHRRWDNAKMKFFNKVYEIPGVHLREESVIRVS